MRIRSICLLIVFLTFHGYLFSQTVPVGLLENMDDNLRRQQLLGNDTSRSSFMIRPLNISERNNFLLDPDKSISLSNFSRSIYTGLNGAFSVSLLPVVWQQQYNGHHPYGWNDGSMVPAKGYQTQVSTGIYAKLGPLSLQLRPEYVYAQNKLFSELQESDNNAEFLHGYSVYYNRIDLPERFGNNHYSQMSWGQSSLRLTVDPVSVGISNENIWWGPGIRSSLLMSNNASGFKHLTLNTSRPVNTLIGSFEAQIVAGKLEHSGYGEIDDPLYEPKPNDWRYLSGMVITYQPKWVPNLFLGFDRSFIVYKNDMGSGLGDYLPFFQPLKKINTDSEDVKERDQYASFFARWVLPESHSEVYFEWGRNDHPFDARDGFVEAEHSRAYIVGFRKLVPLREDNSFIQAGIEFTQMEGSRTGNFREQPPWYIHHQVVDGYTNKGQVLGAGIGPGSNLQSIDVSWVKGFKRAGIQIERLVHNNDLFYSAVKDIRRNWVDLSFAAKFDWPVGHFLLNSQVNIIHSLNYQYEYQSKANSGFFDWNKQDANNLQVKIGLAYLW